MVAGRDYLTRVVHDDTPAPRDTRSRCVAGYEPGAGRSEADCHAGAAEGELQVSSGAHVCDYRTVPRAMADRLPETPKARNGLRQPQARGNYSNLARCALAV